MAEKAKTLDKGQARHRVEHGAPDVITGVVGVEIILVAGREISDALLDELAVSAELGFPRRGQDHRAGLDADREVGRADAALRQVIGAGGIGEFQDRVGCAEFAHHAIETALALIDGDGAAQQGGDLGRRGKVVGQRDRREGPFAVLRHIVFRHGDVADHQFIGFLRGLGEGEDAVLVEDQALDGGIGVVDIGGRLGEIEARFDIGHEAHPVAEDLAAESFAVFLIDQRKDCRRMGVIDELVWQEGVQQRLDGRIRRRWIDEVGALHGNHVLV